MTAFCGPGLPGGAGEGVESGRLDSTTPEPAEVSRNKFTTATAAIDFVHRVTALS